MNRRLLALLLTALLLLCGCSAVSLGPARGIALTDSLDREVTVVPRPAKVVTLSYSLAHLWFTSGGSLLGVTEDTLDRQDISLDGERTELIGTVKSPNTEKILSLAPDLVLYSPDIAAQRETAAVLEKAGIPCYAAVIDTFAQYREVLADMTALTGRSDLARKHGEEAADAIDAMLDRVPGEDPPRVLFLRAASSFVKAKADGHVVCDILEAAGAENIAASDGSLLEELSLEAILEADPDVIFVTTMGDYDAAVEHLNDAFISSPVWGELTAVQNRRVYILTEDLYHYKPNDQWSEAYAILLSYLYPEVFEP